MTIEQAETKIKESGGNVDVFWHWLRGQTVALNDDGSTDVYEYDVDRFIRYKCNPDNEPVDEMD